jgi:hypothetical protein
VIVGTEPARLAGRRAQLRRRGAGGACRPTALDGPVGWKVHWPSTPVHVRGVRVLDVAARGRRRRCPRAAS